MVNPVGVALPRQSSLALLTVRIPLYPPIVESLSQFLISNLLILSRTGTGSLLLDNSLLSWAGFLALFILAATVQLTLRYTTLFEIVSAVQIVTPFPYGVPITVSNGRIRWPDSGLETPVIFP